MRTGDEAAAEDDVELDEGALVGHGVEFEDDGAGSVPVERHVRDIDEVATVKWVLGCRARWARAGCLAV